MSKCKDDCCDDHQTTHQHGPQQVDMERMRAEMARRVNQAKDKFMPLAMFMKKAGLKIKMATIRGTTVEYFRVDEYKELLQKKEKQLEKAGLLRLASQSEQAIRYLKRVEGQPKLKYPQQLEISQSGPNKFATFPFPLPQAGKHWTVLAVLAVLGVVLFPMWPYELKYALWFMSFYTLMAFVAIIIIRLVLYMFVALFGASFWIFPRLFDNVDTIESFKPFCSLSRWQGSNTYSIITRVLLLTFFIYYGYHIYTDPDMVKQNMEITKTLVNDLNKWGQNYIKGERNFSQSALTDYTKLLNSTQQQHPEDDQQFVAYNTPGADL